MYPDRQSQNGKQARVFLMLPIWSQSVIHLGWRKMERCSIDWDIRLLIYFATLFPFLRGIVIFHTYILELLTRKTPFFSIRHVVFDIPDMENYCYLYQTCSFQPFIHGNSHFSSVWHVNFRILYVATLVFSILTCSFQPFIHGNSHFLLSDT